MSADGHLTDSAVRHQVYVQRFGSGLTTKAVKFVRKAINRAKKTVQGGLSQYQSARYQRQIETLSNDLRAIYGDMAEQQRIDYGDFAQYEFTFNTKLLGQVVKASVKLAEPSVEMIAAAVLSDPLELLVGKGRQSINIAGALAQFGTKKTADIISEIGLGAALGEDSRQIIRRLISLGVSHEEQAASLVSTLTNHVSASARNKTFSENDDILEGKQDIATLDGRTTAFCRSIDHRIIPLDGPSPPYHWRCLPGDSLVTASSQISNVSKRWFDGKVIVIKTSTGRELVCTPNHPVLTTSGWVAAEEVEAVGNVVIETGGKWSSFVNGKNENVIPTIHDVSESFFSSSSVLSAPMPTTSEDFHGDSGDNEVAVVGANSLLRDRIQAMPEEYFQKFLLIVRDFSSSIGLESRSNLASFIKGARFASDGFMCGTGDSGDFIGRCDCHSCRLLFGSTSNDSAAFGDDSGNDSRVNIEPFIDSADADTTVVNFDNASFNLVTDGGSFSSKKNESISSENPPNGVLSDIQLDSYVRNGDLPEGIEVDYVESVTVRDFSGHVYNLETESGYYVANGIITHNCRTTQVPVLKAEYRREIPGSVRPAVGPGGAEQVSSKTTYGEWLARQPVSFQREVLGDKRYVLFSKGDLTLDRFVDGETGKQYTLDQLKELEPHAFELAGLD